jgi:hypothetical protein
VVSRAADHILSGITPHHRGTKSPDTLHRLLKPYTDQVFQGSIHGLLLESRFSL